MDKYTPGTGIGIVKFLEGKKLFLTGGTGFVGKVLIEKILRTAPAVGKIYLLIKAKDEEAAMQRLKDEIIYKELFKILQERYEDGYADFMMTKLIPVVGNTCGIKLGLDPDIADSVSEEIDVILNVAANTTFDERYDVAIDANTLAPYRMMSFAKKCKKLKLFVHISTVYVNGHKDLEDKTAFEISVKAHLSKVDIEEEVRLAFQMNPEEQIEDSVFAQRKKLLGLERAQKHGWKSVYTFTKAMGELIVEETREDVPLIIIRPSIIEGTFKDPFPGWIEGIRMADPIILSYGKRRLTGYFANPNTILDIVPVDMITSAILAIMSVHGTMKTRDLKVYHIASSTINPIRIGDLIKYAREHFTSLPLMDSKGRSIRIAPMKFFSSMDDFSNHHRKLIVEQLVSSPVSDNVSKEEFESICKKSLEKAQYLPVLYEPYTFYAGRLDNTNTQKLIDIMSEEEKRDFEFDVGSIDWQHYIGKVHIPGLLKHVLKAKETSRSKI